MNKLINYWEIIVPEYIPMAILGTFVGAIATTHALPNINFLALIISFSCIVAGFNTFNAIADRKIDQINKPLRPLVSKKISESEAKLLSVFFYATALLLSLFLGTYVFSIAIISTIITILYSLKPIYLKKRFLVGNLVGAILYGLLCPLAGWALTPSLGLPLVIILTLFLLAIGLSFLKDFEDVVGDKKYDIDTLPLKLRRYQSVLVILSVTTIAFAYLTYTIYSNLLPQKYYLLLIFYPILFFNIYSYKNPSNQKLMAHLFRITVTIIMGLEIAIALITLTL